MTEEQLKQAAFMRALYNVDGNKAEIEKLKAEIADLKRTKEAKEKATAKSIADWITFRAFHDGYAEPVQNVLSELSDLIKRNYGVEVEGNE